MQARQDTYATFYDKKVLDNLLSGDTVYVYLPRNKHKKLAKKWRGPYRITRTEHPVYNMEIKTEKGLETNVYARDKLKKVTATIAEDQTDQ